MLSRTKPATGPGSTPAATKEKQKKKIPKLEDYINMRDYTGAMTLLDVCSSLLGGLFLMIN
jgi:intraflagellar transport protein 56